MQYSILLQTFESLIDDNDSISTGTSNMYEVCYKPKVSICHFNGGFIMYQNFHTLQTEVIAKQDQLIKRKVPDMLVAVVRQCNGK